MRFHILAGALLCASTALAQLPPADDFLTSANYRALTSRQRGAFFVSDTLFSPLTYATAAGGGSLGQLANAPPEWRQGMEGYSRRFASVLGTVVIQDSIHATGAAMTGYEPRYVHCGCKGLLKRIGHATVWSIMTKNNAGANRLDVPALAGAYGSGMISTLWYPDRFDPLKDGVRAGNQQLGFRVGANWVREFSPELKRALHLR